jgi:hypothetical protein
LYDEADDAGDDGHQTHPGVHPERTDLGRLVDAERLHPQPAHAIAGHIEPEQLAGTQPAPPVDQEQHDAEPDVPEAFVEEGGVVRGVGVVTGRTVGRIDLQAPRQGRRATEQLLVPPVAPTPDGLGQR